MSDQPVRSAAQSAPLLPAGILGRYPAVTFVGPFLVYLLLGALEPAPGQSAQAAGGWALPVVPYSAYPALYTVKILATTTAMLLVLRGYRAFPLRVSPLGLLVGGLGGVAWIVLSELRLEARILAPLGLDGWLELGARPAFNPLEQLRSHPAWAYGFLAIRFAGLVLVVPVIEEFFLRGFLMRFVSDPQWWKLPLRGISRAGLIAGTAVPMLYHPEMVAALVWFSAVSWLMLRTGSIWDCVAAHAVTNLLLGVYVVASGQWWLM